MSEPLVALTRPEPGILWLTMQRPEVLNALNDDLKLELTRAIHLAADDPQVRVVVLTGAGRGFSAGQDLTDARALLEGGEPDLAQNLRSCYHPLVLAMHELEKPIVGMVNGVAAGAGLSLALACDLRLAATDTKLAVGFAGIGLMPDAGASFMLPRLVGLGRAFELAAMGEAIGAEEALRLGLVNRVVPAEALAGTTLEVARRLAAAPTRALGLTKRAFRAAFEHDLATQLELEAALQRKAGRTADFREGLMAFAQKRPPAFKGN